jgi:hypothetical protein
LTLKTVLLAATAAAALIGAAMMAVPSAEEGSRVCLGLSKCLSFGPVAPLAPGAP